MEASILHALPIVLALEPAGGEAPPPLTLDREQAAELANWVATDLQGLLPGVEQARLALAGALFDPVELLRPGFPVWSTLDELTRRVPRGTLQNVVAFGRYDGHMPAPALQPSEEFAAGPLRLLPMSLLVSADDRDALAEQIELQLIGRGEVGTRTADWLMRTLGTRLEHVRYLSRNDLLALTCVQYEHVNLASLWSLLETALLTPERPESCLSARGLPLRYADGAVRVQSPAQWLAAQGGDHDARVHAFAGVLFELRQYAALLQAHRLPLQLEHGQGDTDKGYLLEHLADADAGADANANAEPPQLFGHEARGLGIIAVTVAQRGNDGAMQILAHGYPLQAGGLEALKTTFSTRYGSARELHALGRVVLDPEGRLGVPAATLP